MQSTLMTTTDTFGSSMRATWTHVPHRLDVVAGVTEVANRMKISPMVVLGQRLADSQYVPGFGELIRSAL